MKSFERYHPISNFIFFIFVIFLSMITMHPIVILSSLICSMIFYAMLVGVRKYLQSALYAFIVIALITITNPIFVQSGKTLLFSVFGLRVTFEALVYGFFISCMLVSVFFWFGCYSNILTADKFMYLFGRILPKLSLIFCMTLMFIPRFRRQYKQIYAAQKALGQFSKKRKFSRLRNYISVLSILFSWSLENSIETADCMRSRGYGLKNRTMCIRYSVRMSDIIFIIASSILFGVCIYLEFSGKINFSYYPIFESMQFSIFHIVSYISSALLFSSVIFIQVKEGIKWQILKSKI